MLNHEEQKICKLLAINPHDFIEARNREQTALQQQGPDKLSAEEQKAMDAALIAVTKAMKISLHELKRLQEQHEACRLTYEETEVCKKLGIRPVDYLEEKMRAAGIKEYFGMKID